MLVINSMSADARVDKEAASLAAAGHDVTVVAVAEDGLPGQESRAGFRILRLPYRWAYKERLVAARRSRRIGGLVRYVAGGIRIKAARSLLLPEDYWDSIGSRLVDEIEPCDVVHAHDLGPLLAAVRLAGAWEGRLPNRPAVVYDSHELYVEQLARWKPWEKRAWQRREARLIRSADRVITVSTQIAAELRRRYRLDRDPLVVLNSPRRTALDAGAGAGPGEPDVRADLGLDPAVPLVVYAGAVRPGRGVEALVEALPLAGQGPGRRWHLALVGPGGARHLDTVVARAAALGVGDRLHRLPAVPAESLPVYLRTADVGAHPLLDNCLNHRLAMPNKLFDYLFAGLPVAVTEGTVMAEFVTRLGHGATFAPDRPATVAAAIAELVGRGPAARIPDATVAGLAAEHGWPAMESRLLAAYADLSPPHLSADGRVGGGSHG
jgi:glycosyltransferase involved in cell wall biosynthesis